MKRLKYLLIAGVSLLLTSCENFLDRQPESSLSGETFWTSEQDLKTWNAGMYDGLQSTLRTNWFYWGELRSGVYAERGTAYDRNLLYNGLNSQSGSSSWSDLYKTIYRANAAIKHIPTSPIGSSVSAPYLGQAYAMRALMYFYAIRVWGGVPKITEPMEDVSSQERYYGRTSVEELKAFILEDIEKALEHIGASTDMSSASKYYLNRGAIMALRVDVLMWYKEYDKALVAANDLLTNYKYSLEPASTYSSMFLNPSSSKEMIFNLFWNYEEDSNGFGYAQELASGSNTIRYHPTKAYYKELVSRKREDNRVTMIMDTFAIPNCTSYPLDAMNVLALASITSLYPRDSTRSYKPFNSISIIFSIASSESWSKVIISSTRFRNSGANDLFKAFCITPREYSLSSVRFWAAKPTPRPKSFN